MQSLLVVETDVAAQGIAKLLVGAEGFSVKLLGLHGVEERLHMRVVVHLASTVHALQHSQPGKLLTVLVRCVLDAAVAMAAGCDTTGKSASGSSGSGSGSSTGTSRGAMAYDWYTGDRESENRRSPEIEALFGLEQVGEALTKSQREPIPKS